MDDRTKKVLKMSREEIQMEQSLMLTEVLIRLYALESIVLKKNLVSKTELENEIKDVSDDFYARLRNIQAEYEQELPYQSSLGLDTKIKN